MKLVQQLPNLSAVFDLLGSSEFETLQCTVQSCKQNPELLLSCVQFSLPVGEVGEEAKLFCSETCFSHYRNSAAATIAALP
jgi:hypothetical protein